MPRLFSLLPLFSLLSFGLSFRLSLLLSFSLDILCYPLRSSLSKGIHRTAERRFCGGFHTFVFADLFVYAGTVWIPNREPSSMNAR